MEFVSELSNLTDLILGVLVFVVILIFSKELKELLGRLTEFRYGQAHVRAELTKDEASTERSEHGEDFSEPRRDEAIWLATHFWRDLDESALVPLRNLTEDPEIASLVYRMIGIYLFSSGRAVKAAEAFHVSIEIASSAEEAAAAIILRARILSRTGQIELAVEELEHWLQPAENTGRGLSAALV